MEAIQTRRQPVAIKQFFDAVGNAVGPKKTLTAEAAEGVLKDNSIVVPDAVQALLGKFDKKFHADILDSVRKGAEEYEVQHGFEPDPTFVEVAIQNAVRTATPLKALGLGSDVRLDNATNAHHDQISLQPATAAVSIMAQFAEAVPFASYLSADIKSNEAWLFIMDNKANSDFGDYAANSSLNGIEGGGAYVNAERICQLTINGGAGPFAFTVKARTNDTGAGVPLLRGRTVILVNGLPCARDVEGYGAGANTVTGSVTIAGTTYVLGGTVNTDTGAMSITTSTALPAGTKVHALAYMDYEKAPQLAPLFGVEVNRYKMFAYASRGIAKNTIDSMTQMQNELSMDPRGQALLSIRSQSAQERHYIALKKMLMVADGVAPKVWNYDYTGQIAQKDRSQIWLNLMPILAAGSQEMANATIDHGITTLYFTGELAAQLRGLPSTMFQSSGLVDRPGIYRLGRLFGMYECYYLPPGKGLVETNNGDTSQILAIGRGSSVGRNPIVLGDAVPAIFMPLATGTDLVTQDGFYHRGFTELNPHQPSAQAAIRIDVTDIK